MLSVPMPNTTLRPSQGIIGWFMQDVASVTNGTINGQTVISGYALKNFDLEATSVTPAVLEGVSGNLQTCLGSSYRLALA